MELIAIAFALCATLVSSFAPPASLRSRLASLDSAHPSLQPPPTSLRSRLASLDSAHPSLQPPPARGSALFSPGVRVSPLDYGGDPLGKRDSSAALSQCVAACVNYSAAIDFLGHFPGDASFGNGRFIANAGGCEIDLGGGEFLLSAPVVIPEYVGNLRLGHGSLVADDTPGVFQNGSFLVVVGVEGSCNVPQGSCNVDLGLYVFARRAAAKTSRALAITNSAPSTPNPNNRTQQP